MLKLFELEINSEAKTAHLVLLALKGDPKKSAPVLPGHSASAGNAWLKSNFRCASIPRASFRDQILCSFLEEALKQNLKIRCSCWQKLRPPNS